MLKPLILKTCMSQANTTVVFIFIWHNSKAKCLTIIVLSIVEVRKLSVRKFEWFASNHLGSKWWIYDSRPIPFHTEKLYILPVSPVRHHKWKIAIPGWLNNGIFICERKYFERNFSLKLEQNKNIKMYSCNIVCQ